MKLKKILSGVKVLYADEYKNIDIKDVCFDTKMVTKDSIFVCLKGAKSDGHNFKEQAKQKGACAFIVENYDYSFNGVQILVENSRQALSVLCHNFYKTKKSLKVIGITGTNGKTTTSYLLANILKCAKKRVGVIGTEGIVYNGKKFNLNMTTPDPTFLYKFLSIMSKEKIEYVVMEVSAHAIFLDKVFSINFYAKGFTNLTNDHLDFFGSIKEYGKTKASFIKQGECIKVVNNDDDFCNELSKTTKNIYTFGKDESADVFTYDESEDFSSYTINVFDKHINVNTKLIGSYNMENSLLATTLASLMGISEKHIKNGLESFTGVKGRFNILKNGNKTIIIDFAHTPDAFERIFTTVKAFNRGKMYCVFGCGGNRDDTKRKTMGEIADKYCDFVYISNDNPRQEDPKQIAESVAGGINSKSYEIILDRSLAIQKAVKNMQDGDILLLLGKGTEDYIEINGKKHKYSEYKEAEKWGFK